MNIVQPGGGGMPRFMIFVRMRADDQRGRRNLFGQFAHEPERCFKHRAFVGQEGVFDFIALCIAGPMRQAQPRPCGVRLLTVG